MKSLRNVIFIALLPLSCVVQPHFVRFEALERGTDPICLTCDIDFQLATLRGTGSYLNAGFEWRAYERTMTFTKFVLGGGVHFERIGPFGFDAGGELGVGNPDAGAHERSGVYLGATGTVLFRLYNLGDQAPTFRAVMFLIDLALIGRAGIWSLPGAPEDPTRYQFSSQLGLRFSVGSDLFEEEFLGGGDY